MSTHTGVTILGIAFYRLHIAGFETGSYVEERESLPEILAALETNHVELTKVIENIPTGIRFEGVTRNGDPVRVSIAFYRKAYPKSGWPAAETLLGKKGWIS